MITNEVPVTILQVYFSLPRHMYVNKMEYYVGFMYSSSGLVASNFEKNQENFKGGLCLNVITPFTIIVAVLHLRDVPKTVI